MGHVAAATGRKVTRPVLFLTIEHSKASGTHDGMLFGERWRLSIFLPATDVLSGIFLLLILYLVFAATLGPIYRDLRLRVSQEI